MNTGEYLQNTTQLFSYYKLLAERTFEQLSGEELWWTPSPEANSVGIIVKHLAGNMKSRWTDFLISDGEKPWRERDDEFEMESLTKDEILELWESGWQCLFKALEGINENNFTRAIRIRNQEHSVQQAIQRQLTHYSYHVGQIVYLGKLIRGNEWRSLSIPKGESENYSKRMNE